MGILVNNSGGKTGEGQTPWWELTIDDWLQTYQMCVLSAVRLIKRLVPGMNRDFHFGLPGTIQPESSRSKEIISSPTIRQGSHGRSCDSPTPPILPCAGHWEQTQ